MTFSRISFLFSSVVVCSFFVACAAPVDTADLAAEELAAHATDTDLEAAAWSASGTTSGSSNKDGSSSGGTTWGTGGSSGGNKNWSPEYATAVATAQAVAQNGGTAEATAKAFADKVKKKKDWQKQACVVTALAVAEAVAIDSCTGGVTVARAVAQVQSC